MTRRLATFLTLLLAFLLLAAGDKGKSMCPFCSQQHSGFVEVNAVVPNVIIDVRYAETNNFIGRKIIGYNAAKIFLSKPAADSLKKAIDQFNAMGFGVILYDGYRPQKAVDYFVRWSNDLSDTLKKREFYPDVMKKELFREGYIASKSGHSRGSTIDLSLTDLATGSVIDMGTPYDFFGPQSKPKYPGVTRDQQVKRMILRNVMLNNGFKPLDTEWWHFTLRNEPYPNTYFNFDIE